MPIKLRFAVVHVSRRIKHRLRWGFIHVALVIFFADFLGCVWPAFGRVWERNAHVAVVLATVLATAAEYFVDEDDAQHREAEANQAEADHINQVEPIASAQPQPEVH